MIPGETVASGAPDPGTPLTVLSTPAGYYIGYLTEDGFPYSRESGYYATEEEAQEAMKGGGYERS
jgi:hypothetical protein